MSIRLTIILFWSLSVSAWAGFEILPASKIAKVKEGPCVFIHTWATWCDICVRELEDLLKALAKETRVKPYVIDISSPFVQKTFSKAFIKRFNVPFTTYLKPGGPDRDYMNAVDETWNQGLPFSVLYHGGAKRAVWNGPVDLQKFPKEISELCK